MRSKQQLLKPRLKLRKIETLETEIQFPTMRQLPYPIIVISPRGRVQASQNYLHYQAWLATLKLCPRKKETQVRKLELPKKKKNLTLTVYNSTKHLFFSIFSLTIMSIAGKTFHGKALSVPLLDIFLCQQHQLRVINILIYFSLEAFTNSKQVSNKQKKRLLRHLYMTF